MSERTALIVALLLIATGTVWPFDVPKMQPSSLGPYRSYLEKRANIIRSELRLTIGSHLRLSARERAVDAHLLRLKRAEIEEGVRHPHRYAPGMHFFAARPLIERSGVFRVLRRMPKGALLHGHNSAMVSVEWLVGNLSRMPDMLICTTGTWTEGNETMPVVLLTFRRADWHRCRTDYERVVDQRAAAPDPDEYDRRLERALSLYSDQPAIAYPDINTVWQRFDGIFAAVSDVLTYEKTFGLVYWRLLQEAYDDRVMYLEIRTGFSQIYYADGNRTSSETDCIREVQRIVAEFRRTHPSFVGAKFIYSKSRNRDDIDELFDRYRQYKAEFPDMIVGFDLVGQEDTGKTLISLAAKVLANPDIKYMFHAGETDWSGHASDRNLLDAILMNATRIGHGYSLYKHPIMLDIVRRRRICLEVCPISNQVLGLVNDLRNHPGTIFSALDVPMVISNDDPGFWGATGLSFDFYYALMSFTGIDVGLAYVKQLALNSIEYSMLNAGERRRANAIFTRQWNTFVEHVIAENGLIVNV